MKNISVKFKRWWVALSAICLPVGALLCIIYMSNLDSSVASDNPKVFQSEIKKHVPIGTSGGKAFKVMQSNGFSCEVDSSSYGKSITCKRKDSFLPMIKGGNKWYAYLQLREGKVYKVETDVYPD